VTALVTREPGIKVGSVAKALGVTGPRAVQIVNVLEAEGIVERTADGLVLGALGQRDGNVSR